jgi:nucleoside-diphosphate-sugar epimerase
MSQCVLITGGSGFIGTWLTRRLLAAGWQVRLFDLVPSRAFPELWVRGDVRDAAGLAAELRGCEVAVDLAAEHRDDVRPLERYAETNIGGARHLVAAAQAHGLRRLVFVSSAAVYGLHTHPDETAPLQPVTPYGASKVEAEALYRQWQDQAPDERSLRVVRPSVVFGPGHRGNVATLIEQIRRGRFVMVGAGRERKSIVYVENLADFLFLQVQERAAGAQTFNYADKPDLTTAELVRAIRTLLPRKRAMPRLPYAPALLAAYAFDALAALSGRPLPIGSARLRKFCRETRLETPALATSGFRPRWSIAEGLARTVEAGPDAAP